MAHIPPLDMDSHPELQPAFASAAAAMGFVPNSTRTMAHMRQLPFVFSALFATIMGGDAKAIFAGLQEVIPEQNAAEENLPAELLQLIAYCVSLCGLSLLSGSHWPQHRARQWRPGTAG